MDPKIVAGLQVTANEYGLDATKWADLALLTFIIPFVPDDVARFPFGKFKTLQVVQAHLDQHASKEVRRITLNKENKDIVKSE
jgi:hypothetical protein